MRARSKAAEAAVAERNTADAAVANTNASHANALKGKREEDGDEKMNNT